MKDHLRSFLIFILGVSVLLGACELPVTHRYNVLFEFEIPPIQDATMPLGSSLDIVVSVFVPFPPDYRLGSVPGSQPILNNVKFFANAAEIGNAEVISSDSYPVSTAGTTRGQLFHATRTWTPTEPGLYYLQVQAILNLGSPVYGDYSYALRFCVIGDIADIRLCTVGGITPIPYSAPFSFSTPTLTAVPTETPQGLCPPGTYYAPVTNQCIPIQINPTKSGGPNCAQYTTDTSCNAAPGCSYDYVAKKCKSK
jgi:hypothetical protein